MHATSDFKFVARIVRVAKNLNKFQFTSIEYLSLNVFVISKYHPKKKHFEYSLKSRLRTNARHHRNDDDGDDSKIVL